MLTNKRLSPLCLLSPISARQEKIPPQRLMAKETGPLKSSTKRLFKNATEKPHLFPIKNREYITMMLELPNFTPAGRKGKGGKELSTKESTAAIESSKEANISSLKSVLFFFTL